MYPDSDPQGGQRLSFSTGPNIYSWVGIMLAAIMVVIGALKAWMPTAPPQAYLAGGEVLAAAEAHQRLLAIGFGLIGLMVLVWLARWRRCVLDFDKATLRLTTFALSGAGSRILTFSALSRAEAWSRERDAGLPNEMTLFGLDIHPEGGRRIRIGPDAVDWGVEALAERLNAAIAAAKQGSRQA